MRLPNLAVVALRLCHTTLASLFFLKFPLAVSPPVGYLCMLVASVCEVALQLGGVRRA